MKYLLLLISLTAFSSPTLEEHNKAAKKFFNFHFFENGRGMTITPNMSKFMWMLGKGERGDFFTKIIQDRYGFIVKKDQKLLGVFDVKYKDMNIGVLGCTACHSGKAAGRLIPGLGNKTIDAYLVGKDSKNIQQLWGLSAKTPEHKYIHSKAMHFANVNSDKNISNLTRGLVSDAVIKTFFYKDNGIDYPKDMGRAQVKVPHLWGIGEKKDHGIFNEGALDGRNYAWIFGAELFGSDSADHLRAVLPRLRNFTDNVISKLLPPDYPFQINHERAKQGEKLFANNCMSCHGEHRRNIRGYPLYTAPKVVSNEKVGTDADKLNAISDEFVELVQTSSLNDLLFFNKEKIRKGYFAPKLWGIWSRFPYLHNGSVPTVFDLLSEPRKRPIIFSMKDAGEESRFNSKKLGLTAIRAKDYRESLNIARRGNRNIYYTKREGHSNKGHYFKHFDKLTDKNKLEIIEYLKTL